jgi:predicted amidohydrolase
VLIVALSTAACAFADTYWQLLLFRALGGVGSTMFFVSALGLMIRMSPPDARGRVAGMFSGAFLVGSVAERFDATHCYNTSLLFSPEGDLLAYYRKIHLFDIDIPGGPRFQESATIRPGAEVVVVPTALGQLGLSICYDLRFPLLTQRLVEKGAEILMVPSAFTLQTGKDHWHPLLRARAIESQCYLMAPAQEGPHDSGGLRHSYGHSLIIDPWGTVLAECGEGPGLCLAEIDLERVRKIRRAIPVRQHQVRL